MKSSLSLVTAAADRGLLSIDQLRAAAGVSDNSQDAKLKSVGESVADIISHWCNIARAGIEPPTLRQEVLAQVFWPSQCLDTLILARRFIGTAQVVENGAALALGDFDVSSSAGTIIRLKGGEPCEWPTGTISVTYQAGFTVVPSDLAEVAAEMVSRRSGTTRDPMLKRKQIEVPGVETIEEEFWVDANAAVDITPDMASILSAYSTPSFG